MGSDHSSSSISGCGKALSCDHTVGQGLLVVDVGRYKYKGARTITEVTKPCGPHHILEASRRICLFVIPLVLLEGICRPEI